MAKIIIHQDKAADPQALMSLCPFGAIEYANGELSISAACRMCRICCKKGGGVFEFADDEADKGVDKSLWQGIAVVAEHRHTACTNPVLSAVMLIILFFKSFQKHFLNLFRT